jgi:hypothetical protein
VNFIVTSSKVTDANPNTPVITLQVSGGWIDTNLETVIGLGHMQGPGCHPSTRRKKREKKVVPSRLGNKSCIQKAHITHKTPGCRVIFKGFPICQKPQLRTRWQWRLHFQHQETLDSQGLPGMGTGDPPRTTAPSTWPLQTLRSLL